MVFRIIILLFCFNVHGLFPASSLRVLNRTNDHEYELRTLERITGKYISVKDLAHALKARVYENRERGKIVLYLGDHRIKLSGTISYVLVDEQVYQMPIFAITVEDDIYVPVEAFFSILRNTVLPGLMYDPKKQLVSINFVEFNIVGVKIDEKANGTILRIQTRKRFSERNISSFINQNRWLYITISDALVDTTEIKRTDTRGVIRTVVPDQLGNAVQLAFQLRSEILGYEWYQSSDPSEIVFTLRTPLAKSSARIKDVRDRWYLDTVVLDASHGGKDPGAVGKKTKEKNITLDITKRVGLLFETNTHIKVVYTRNEDVFVPLWKRTKIANENNGKVFVSIHANSSKNRNVHGFETYLLRPGKTDDAIKVAARENAVIKLEDVADKYTPITGENLIMATMAQSMFMKESEDLAATIQEEMDKQLTSLNRGVKQAGFHVLIGASMPNVLVEVGFLSNPIEEKNLKTASYRQKIAQAVYSAIIKFKDSREQLLAEE